jgi:hypothetical protein
MHRTAFISVLSATLAIGASAFPGEPPLDARRRAARAALVAKLVKQLGHDEWRMREEASRQLRSAGAPALAPLKAALKSKDLEIRTRAAEAVEVIERNIILATIGNTLIAEYASNRVVEVNRDGIDVWSVKTPSSPYSARRLADGNTVVALTNGKVMIYNRDKKVVWEFAGRGQAVYADRLPNGNVLVAGVSSGTVTEYDWKKKVVWQVKNLGYVGTCQRLPNGNTLLAQYEARRVIEVDKAGKTVWKLEKQGRAFSAQRLPSGNTLVCSYSPPGLREVDPKGKVVWNFPNPANLGQPTHAVMLKNGHIVVTDYSRGRILQVTRKGGFVWQKAGLRNPFTAARVADPARPDDVADLPVAEKRSAAAPAEARVAKKPAAAGARVAKKPAPK